MGLFCPRWPLIVGGLALAASVLLAACGGGSEVTVGQSQSGSTMSAARGDVLVLRLPENPTTGYSWKMTLSDGLTLESDEYIPDEQSGDLVGVGGTHQWRIELSETGKQSVDGVYRQEWDPTQSPQYFTLTVNVE